ncbi:phospholipid metabolism-regulating protein SCS22 [Lachancea thermotolerans CBS 6340]|uniref:KLTH0C05940p n=1 Tax=Lachancea thermotolerans (strain ATCC 56472 / CBS 6340 / NRRL Y-8284) TaxID=559295 RepID=C5DE34_LACTC|nr:KLTH0C05940p [Lachancea thermotolerans CBS 6340]CAR22045.1 KLTH0C05940p [Lachancea thermotolerans CBS 6340]
MIEIKPSVLEYKPPLTAQATEYVTVTNNTDQAVAFKVKTTAPKFYCVRPNAALVAPGEQVQVQVILLGLAEEPAPDFKCKDKFLVITLPAPYDLGASSVTEAWPQLESEFKQHAVSKKIKVKYLLGDEAPVRAEESSAAVKREEPVGAKAAGASSSAPQAEEPQETKAVTLKPEEPAQKPALGAVQEDVKPEAAPEPEPVSKAAAATAGGASEKHVAQKQEAAINPAIIALVLLIALVLGWKFH